MNLQRLSVITTVCLLSATSLAKSLALEKIGDSIVDAEALHFTNGTWGKCVNGQTFQQDALTTFRDHQYATYYDSSRRLCVARRKLEAPTWDVVRFSDYTFKGNDTHNVAVIGICPGDGTIHLSFDHHGHPLHYRVSQKGVASKPAQHAWTTNLFSQITSELEPGTKLTKVTYPRFVRRPDGGLHFGCRIGGSGDGTKYLADYDAKSGKWQDFGSCIASSGNYLGQTSRNPYLNGYTYDAKGRLHVTWCWRETPDPMSNHDLAYAWSKDGGKTWLNNEGVRIGQRGTAPVDITAPGVNAVTIPMKRGLINAATQAVDSRGRVHVATVHMEDDAPEEKDWETTRKNSFYFHYWRDANGTWKRNKLPWIGSRPQLWTDTGDNLYLVFLGDRFNPSPSLSIATATRQSKWTDWKLIHQEAGPFSGQPQIDRYGKRNELHIYIQQEPTVPNGTSSPLRVLTFKRNAD